LDEAPAFDLEEAWFINAFNRLDKSRPPRIQGNHYIPIPISEYLAYFTLFPPVYEVDTTLEILQDIDEKVYGETIKKYASKNRKKTKFSADNATDPQSEPMPTRIGPK
jgi:hypothetical protein